MKLKLTLATALTLLFLGCDSDPQGWLPIETRHSESLKEIKSYLGTPKRDESGSRVFSAIFNALNNRDPMTLGAPEIIIVSLDGSSGRCSIHWIASDPFIDAVAITLDERRLIISLSDEDRLTQRQRARSSVYSGTIIDIPKEWHGGDLHLMRGNRVVSVSGYRLSSR
jgi:hypothetical protein